MVIGGIVDPAFDRYGVVLTTRLSIRLERATRERGASMRMKKGKKKKKKKKRTWMKHVTGRTVIDDHDLTEVGLDTAQVFDVITATKGTVLAIVTTDEVFPILLEPVDDRIGIFLYRRRKDDELVPFADLVRCQRVIGPWTWGETSRTCLAQELITVWPFVNVVQDRVLRSKGSGARPGDGGVQLHFDHMAGAHPTSFRQAMDERLV